MQQRSVPHWQRFLGKSSLHCVCSKQGLPPNIPSFVWMPWRQSYTLNLLGFGFPMNSCFTLHLYSEGDWAHAGHSNTNPNAEVCETSHKEEATAPTKPAAFSVRTLPDNTAPFRKPHSLLPWNWKLAFSSNPRRLKKKKRLSKTELLTFMNLTEKVWLLLLDFQLFRWVVKWKQLFQIVLPDCQLAGNLFKGFRYWHKPTYGYVFNKLVAVHSWELIKDCRCNSLFSYS